MPKEQTAELQTELQNSQSALAESAKLIDELMTGRENLVAELEEAKKQNMSIAAELEDMKALVEQLQSAPGATASSETETIDAVGQCFTVDDVTYKILVPAMRIPNFGKISAAELLVNEAAQRQLVKIDSRFIQKQY